MNDRHVGVLGARSLVGECLLPVLLAAGWQVTAVSRQTMISNQSGLEWRQWPASDMDIDFPIDHWISLLPIWMLPEFIPLLERYGVQRIVALSSTSRYVKVDSTEPRERDQATLLADGELYLQKWAESAGKQWVILRPTLVYGLGRDKNISEMARFIRRFGFFPLFAGGRGLRQPIHARDVADICTKAICLASVRNKAYDISGAISLTYRDMTIEVFRGLGMNPRILDVPLWCAKLALMLVHLRSGNRDWSTAMFERMGRDLVFDHEEAVRDLEFKPGAFSISQTDLPA